MQGEMRRGRPRGDETQALNLRLPPDVVKLAKLRALVDDTTVSAYIASLIAADKRLGPEVQGVLSTEVEGESSMTGRFNVCWRRPGFGGWDTLDVPLSREDAGRVASIISFSIDVDGLKIVERETGHVHCGFNAVDGKRYALDAKGDPCDPGPAGEGG